MLDYFFLICCPLNSSKKEKERKETELSYPNTNEEASAAQWAKGTPSREKVSQNNHKSPWRGSRQSWKSCSAAWQPSAARGRRASARPDSAWSVPVRRALPSLQQRVFCFFFHWYLRLCRFGRAEKRLLEFMRLNISLFVSETAAQLSLKSRGEDQLPSTWAAQSATAAMERLGCVLTPTAI